MQQREAEHEQARADDGEQREADVAPTVEHRHQEQEQQQVDETPTEVRPRVHGGEGDGEPVFEGRSGAGAWRGEQERVPLVRLRSDDGQDGRRKRDDLQDPDDEEGNGEPRDRSRNSPTATLPLERGRQGPPADEQEEDRLRLSVQAADGERSARDDAADEGD